MNSDKTDSFHSWSSNCRWFIFSSKRDGGLFTRLYFSHVDSSGKTTKPFVLPQDDPSFYKASLKVFNVTELMTEPVYIHPQDLANAAFSKEDAITARLDPKVALWVSTKK